MSYEPDRDAFREERSINKLKNSDRHRYSKVFRHTCRACAIYLMLWAIAVTALLVGALFDFFQAILSLVLSLTPNLLKLGCILTVAVIIAVIYEGVREDIRRDD